MQSSTKGDENEGGKADYDEKADDEEEADYDEETRNENENNVESDAKEDLIVYVTLLRRLGKTSWHRLRMHLAVQLFRNARIDLQAAHTKSLLALRNQF